MAKLEITTVIGCPLMCTFCPQDALIKSFDKSGDKVMSLETFATILEKVPMHVQLDFSGMSEPWANPQATRMLEMALQAGRRVSIYTTLQGMSLEDSEFITQKLVPAHREQFDVICLHMPDDKMNMRGYKGGDAYRQVLRNFLALRDAQVVRSFKTMTMDKGGVVHSDLVDLLPQLGAWRGHSRAGSLSPKAMEATGALKPAHHEFPLMCGSTPFYDHNVVLPNGDVVLCCMDYALKHVIGNLVRDDYWSLFTSAEMTQLRVENQKAEFSKCTICKQCGNIAKYDAGTNRVFGYGQQNKKVRFKDVVGYFKDKAGSLVGK
jgi:hypothetical protein